MIKLILPLVLIFGIIGGVYLVQNRVNLFPQAQEGAFQERVTISNITPTALAISYFTTAPTHDFIQYGENTDVPIPVYDVRMSDGLNPALYTHYFEVKNLRPDTSYYFKINSDGKLLPHGSYLTFKTPREISGESNFINFSGSVKKSSGIEPVEEGIVFLSYEGGQLLSAPVESDAGKWGITFNGMRNADLNKYSELSDIEQIKFLAYAGIEGFGMFGEYAFKKDNINIIVEEGRVPFFRINVGQAGISSVTGEAEPVDENNNSGPFWVKIQDFFRGVF